MTSLKNPFEGRRASPKTTLLFKRKALKLNTLAKVKLEIRQTFEEWLLPLRSPDYMLHS